MSRSYLLTLPLFTLLLTNSLQANEVQSTEKRIHSVRKVVDGVRRIDDKEVSEVDKARQMFSEGKVSGQLRLMYSKAPDPQDLYSTAIGGIIKYELAEFHGFNAGAAVYTSYDIPALSAETSKRYTDLSSDKGNHTDMGEAYLNYHYDALNLRAGRQVLDTPLADSDDIRMIPNSFEAYTAAYEYSDVKMLAGYISRWHGVDAGLPEEWAKAGEDGTFFGGLSYDKGLEFNAWFYNITELTNATYLDVGAAYPLSKDMLIHLGAQYLNESELANSGVEASIYGAMCEFVLYDIGFNLAFDKSERRANKDTFSGFGGGTLYTSMDTSILNDIAEDREALAIVGGVSYKYEEFGFFYAYGDFNGKENSQGEKAHNVEQDVGASYEFRDEFLVALIYANLQDKLESTKDWQRAQLMLNYSF